MGMVSNKVEVLVVPETGKAIYFDYALENEIRAELTEDRRLFSGVTTINELIDRIGYGFCDAWDKDEKGNYNFLLDMFEAFGDMDDFDEDDEEDDEDEDCKSSGNFEYDEFVSEIQRLKLNDICSIVLMTNDEDYGGDREFRWIRYDLKTGNVAAGTGKGVYICSDRYYDADECSPTPRAFIESIGK